MKDRYQKQWETLGSYDPYWAVLSDPRKKGGKWEKDEFFRSGQREVEQVLKNLARMQVETHSGTALDFGCGVGRLSRALSKYYDNVIGVDISESMLDEARAVNQGFRNIEFLHNVAENLGRIPSGSIDLVYSNIVLQHMPAIRQTSFISEFCRVLRTDGVAIFQTPSRYNFSALTGWKHFLTGNRLLNIAREAIHRRRGMMEIHTLTREKILEILDKYSMSILEIERYDSTGKGFISYRYYVSRPA